MGRKKIAPDIKRDDRLNIPVTSKEALAMRTIASARGISLGALLREKNISEVLADYEKLEPLVKATMREKEREREAELTAARIEAGFEAEEAEKRAPLDAPVPGDY